MSCSEPDQGCVRQDANQDVQGGDVTGLEEERANDLLMASRSNSDDTKKLAHHMAHGT